MKFKLRLFRSCRSKHPSTLPNHPIPSFHRHNIITVNFPSPSTTSKHHHQQPHRSSFKTHVSSAFGCGSKSDNLSDSDNYFQWQEDDDWHVVAKIYDVESPRRKIYNSSVSDGDTDDDGFSMSLLPLPKLDKKKRRRGRKVKLNKLRNVSTDDSVLFSSEGDGYVRRNGDVLDDETENLILCSRRFSTDSSTDFNPHLETIREFAPISFTNRYKVKKKRDPSLKCNGGGNLTECGYVHRNGDVLEEETENVILSSRSSSTDFNPQLEMIRECAPISVSDRYKQKKRNAPLKFNGGMLPECGSPARLSVFKKLIPCKVEGKMKESFALVKRTEDPYEDFKRSMMEMIMEKQMFEESDLEQLLQCYLSLNSRLHHGVIVEAFTEIWDTMFGDE